METFMWKPKFTRKYRRNLRNKLKGIADVDDIDDCIERNIISHVYKYINDFYNEFGESGDFIDILE